MADDIDIEEHDVLDNPHLKSIFPVITSIKTEIIEYDEEENQYHDEEDMVLEYPEHEDAGIDEERSDVPDYFPNKIILGSKPCASPALDEKEPDILNCCVVLTDWGFILEQSPFCRTCKTLFPTDNALDDHRASTHSLLVAVSRNKAVKSTSKSSITALSLQKTGVLCKHCNKYFPDETALIKHSYELLPQSFLCDECDVSFENEAALISHKLGHDKNGHLPCPICTALFKYEYNFLIHMKQNHGITSLELPERVPLSLQCKLCPSVLNTPKILLQHVKICHSHLFFNKSTKTTDKYECRPCNVTFATAYSEKIHKVSKHSNVLRKAVIPPATPGGSQTKPLPNLGVTHKELTKPVPKSTLFKCNKCQIHFVSCANAVEHSKRCVLKRGDWKCKQCRRAFKMCDRLFHLKQHEMSERLRVIRIRDKIQDRIVCRCLDCDVCFDERTMMKYHLFDCATVQPVKCTLCNLNFHEHAIKKHMRLHSEIGGEFLLIDYVFNNESKLKTLLKASKHKLQKNIRTRNSFIYYYCPSCKFYLKVNNHSHNHHLGICRKNFARHICKLCGLCFNRKCFLTHMKEHKQFPKLTLDNLTFKHVGSEEIMAPPPPDFKKCMSCKVYFFSKIALDSHMCHEEFKTCIYCEEKFSDLAYKLHVPYHEYGNRKKLDADVPELMKKYKSLTTIWNVLFLCKTCDTVLDNYDAVVEHCQDHSCNMESYNATINECQICGLKFVNDSFNRHKSLHAANELERSSFHVIKYDCEKLLSDKWYNIIFKNLSAHQVVQILNNSVYGHNRSVRVDGTVKNNHERFTVYQCAVCKVIVDGNERKEHSEDIDCVHAPKFCCSQCDFKFVSRNMLLSHEVLHKTNYVDVNTFSIIPFNKQLADSNTSDNSYIDMNESGVSSKLNAEELKFIRCTICGKLINKAKYEKHKKYHKYYKYQKKDKSAQPKFVARPKFKSLPSKVILYKCKKCSVCVLKQNILTHFCSNSAHKRQCSKCLLMFRASNLKHHNLLIHEKYKLTRNNIKVMVFRNGKILSGAHTVNEEIAKNTKANDFEEKITKNTRPVNSEENITKNANNFVLYQCKRCRTCMNRKYAIKRHGCMPDQFKKKCNLCEVSFRATHFDYHERYHENFSFSKENLTIEEFEPIRNNTKIFRSFKIKDAPYKSKASLKALQVKKLSQRINRTRKVNYELSLGVFLKRIYYRFYKCHTCENLFVTQSSLFAHVKNCDGQDGVKCNSCDQVFHSSAINVHIKWQKCYNIHKARQLYYVSIKSNGLTVLDDIRSVFLCQHCNLCYMNLDTLISHIDEGHCDVKNPTACDECNLTFTPISKTKHQLFHHEIQKLTSSEVIVMNVENVDPPKVEFHKKDNEMSNENLTSETIPNNDIDDEHQIDDGSFLKDKKINFELTEPGFHKRIQSRFYKCHLCKNLFITESSLFDHIKNCDPNEDGVRCNNCGLVFHTSALNMHKKWQKCASIQMARQIYFASVKFKDIVEYKVGNSVFLCGRCDLCYLKYETLLKHIEENHQANNLVKCEECNLVFTRISNRRHQKLHHKLPNSSFKVIVMNVEILRPTGPVVADIGKLDEDQEIDYDNDIPNDITSLVPPCERNDDFELNGSIFRRINSKFYKCHICEVLFITLATLFEHVKSCNTNEQGVECENCGLVFHSSSLILHKKWQNCLRIGSVMKHVYFSIISKDIVVFDNARCVFVCSRCDVCFLSLYSVYRHVDRITVKCEQTLNTVKCGECNLTLAYANNARHQKLHHSIQGLSSSEIIVMSFDFTNNLNARRELLVGNDDEIQMDNVNDIPISENESESEIENNVTISTYERKIEINNDLAMTENQSEITIVNDNNIVMENKERDIEAENGMSHNESVLNDNTFTEYGEKEINYELSTIGFLKRIQYRFFKCHICKNLFVTQSSLFAHVKSCDGEDGVKCDVCDLVFHSSAVDLHNKWQKCWGMVDLKHIYLISVISKDIDVFEISRSVFMCVPCNLCCLTFETMYKHINENHGEIRNPARCDECYLTFTTVSNTRHRRLHHGVQNLSKSEIIVMAVETQRPLKVRPVSLRLIYEDDDEEDSEDSFVLNVSRTKRKSIKRKNLDEIATVSKKYIKNTLDVRDISGNTSSSSPNSVCNEVNKCEICNLCFLSRNTLSKHNLIGRHTGQGVACVVCGLRFTNKSIQRHLKNHSSFSFGLNETEDASTSVAQNHLVQPSVGTDNSSVKLFKCSACDVYYLTDTVCREHVTNHRLLDPTEYTDCKFCYLQFPCEYLGGHMRTHRENTFNIDRVVVTEYQPNRLIGETYLAADRLKSKVVSTTTHFDTEDERGSVNSIDR